MRKIVARSMAVAMLAVLVSGCSSTGGQKSFSWSSLNPMTYIAKSDSDSPVPKPSDQMAPTVTLPNASAVAESGGTAPPSPYGQTGLGDAVQTAATQASSGAMGPQTGMYDPNGYGGSSLPVSEPSTGYGQYPAASAAYTPPATSTSGYQLPPATNYDTSATAQYNLGGGSYDIQNQPQASTQALPAYANPTAPYASNTSPSTGMSTPPYQSPPMPSQPSGYDTGLAQDPYGSTTPPAYPDAASSYSASTPPTGYANNAPTTPAESANLVASMPQLPPLPDQYQSNQPAYDPGNTGYNPSNVPSYTPPAPGGYVQPAGGTDSNFAPGSVSRYPSTSLPTSGAPAGGYGTTGSVY